MLTAGAGPGASSGAAAGQAGAGDDADFSSPQPGSEFSNEQPLEGDLGGDSFDWDQQGMHLCGTSVLSEERALYVGCCTEYTVSAKPEPLLLMHIRYVCCLLATDANTSVGRCWHLLQVGNKSACCAAIAVTQAA